VAIVAVQEYQAIGDEPVDEGRSWQPAAKGAVVIPVPVEQPATLGELPVCLAEATAQLGLVGGV
jgi:hypothetical protein